jgi:hypothetical protein
VGTSTNRGRETMRDAHRINDLDAFGRFTLKELAADINRGAKSIKWLRDEADDEVWADFEKEVSYTDRRDLRDVLNTLNDLVRRHSA